MKERPKEAVQEPGPAAMRLLLAREDVPAPPEFLRKDVEGQQHEVPERHAPVSAQGHAHQLGGDRRPLNARVERVG